jgi:hypothetical protein
MKRIPSEMFTSFKQLVNELDIFFKAEWDTMSFKDDPVKTKEKHHILLANIRIDLNECSHAFFMLYNSLLKLRTDQQLLLTETTSLSFTNRSQKTQSHITSSTVLIKSVYNYFYSIREMLLSSPELKNLFSATTKSELDRICEFRSKLIVHKQGQKLFTGSARKYNTEDLNITVQIGQYTSISKEVHGQCKKLYESSQKFFPKRDQNFTNYYEMSDMLYKNLDKVPNSLKAEVKGFISAYGVSSDPPLILGYLLKKLLFEYYIFLKEI